MVSIRHSHKVPMPKALEGKSEDFANGYATAVFNQTLASLQEPKNLKAFVEQLDKEGKKK